MSKISIIVPIYNIEKYLKLCLESLINQSFTDIEIICVDDGSTDHSGEICDDYALQDERIIVIHKKNGGLVSARKCGLEIATGEYIGFVDGDDYIEPDMYEQLLAIIQLTGADVVHSGYISRDKVFNPLRFEVADYKDTRCENLRKYVLMSGITPSIWSKLFKKEIINKCYSMVPNTQSYGEDLVCLVNCFCEGVHMVSVDKAFYHYTIRDDSISHVVSDKNYKEEINLYESIIGNLQYYGLLRELQDDMSSYLRRHMVELLNRSMKNDIAIPKYHFKDIDKIRGKKLVVFGAGQVGKDYYSEISRYFDCEIISWVDNNFEKYDYPWRKIEPVQRIFDVEYDYIIIAVLSEKIAYEIKKSLMDRNISSEKIIWEEPQFIY